MKASAKNRAKAITVVVADSHRLTSEGLRSVLEGAPQLMVLGAAASSEDLSQAVACHRPDVVLIGPMMAEAGGPGAVERLVTVLSESSPSSRIALVVDPSCPPETVVSWLQAGVVSAIGSDAGHHELIAMIEETHRNGSSVSPAITLRLVRDTRERPEIQLTQREAQVLTAVAYGLTNAQVAASLFLAVRTVEACRSRIVKKLNLSDRQELVAYAIENGLLGQGSSWDPHVNALQGGADGRAASSGVASERDNRTCPAGGQARRRGGGFGAGLTQGHSLKAV